MIRALPIILIHPMGIPLPGIGKGREEIYFNYNATQKTITRQETDFQ